MHSRDVEFRTLQLVTNVVGDERVTVGLVHWDGRELRFAWGPHRVPKGIATSQDVRAVLASVAADALAKRGDLSLDLGLDQMFEVRQGAGSLLAWGPRHVGQTQNSARHFHELATDLRLREATTEELAAPARRTPPALDARLTTLGNELKIASAHPDRIDTRRVVKGLRPYRSPLSWVNGKWHHSFPVRFDDGDPIAKLERTLGKIDVSLPGDDVGIIVMAHPAGIAKRLHDAAEFVRDRQKGRVDCVAATLTQGGPSLEQLKKRIEKDVRAPRRAR